MPNIARRLLIVTCLVLALAALGLSGFWLYGAERLEQNLQSWADHWRAQGNTVEFKDFEVTGFPLFFRTRLEDFVIGGGTSQAPWRWDAPPLLLRASPFAPTRARATFPGEHHIDAELFGVPVSLTATARHAIGRVQSRGNTGYGTVEIEEASLAVAGAPGQATVADALIDSFVVRRHVDHQTAAAGLTVALRNLVLPKRLSAGPLGAQIDSLTLEAELMGSVAPTLHRTAVAAWRDAGGTVEVARLEVRWGPLRLSAEGTLALDDNLQPLGAFTATVTGFTETLDALVDSGVLQPDEANAAKTLLTLLAKTPLTGGRPQLSVPLTVQNQRVLVGPVPVFTLPRLQWPAT